MAWNDPRGDLRTLLADGPTDNLVKNKLVIGPTNGVNSTFFTFEDRLISSGNQSVCGEPLHLYLGGVEVSASGINVTDQVRGEMQLSFAPSGQAKLTGSYHYQQHLDSEIDVYLQQGLNRIDGGSNTSLVEPGLQPAVLEYAGAMAHRRLAQRWQQRKSEQFMLQDEPARKEAEALITYHRDEAKDMLAEAQVARRDFYDFRQDRGRSPAFGLLN